MGRKKVRSAAKSAATTYQSGSPTTATVRPANVRSQQATSSTPSVSTSTVQSMTVTYEQTAQRAREIWMRKGCRPGEDEQNWLEAETQLKAEMAQ